MAPGTSHGPPGHRHIRYSRCNGVLRCDLGVAPFRRAFYPLQAFLARVSRTGDQQLSAQLVLGPQIVGCGLSLKIIEGQIAAAG